MRSFEGSACNDTFSVGCTGRTVYVYDAEQNEVAKFRDIKYGYLPVISPDNDTFIVKSTDGAMAIYSYKELRILKKLRYSKDPGQDDGCCFSPDGLCFYNIEKHIEEYECRSHIAVYETGDFSKTEEISAEKGMLFRHIEWDPDERGMFVLGSCWDINGYFGGFVAHMVANTIIKTVKITEMEYGFYQRYKNHEIHGYAGKEYVGGMFFGADGNVYQIPKKKHYLSKLFYVHENDVL